MTGYLILVLLLFYDSASPGATSLHQLFIYFLIAAAFVFLGVTGMVVYACIRYRSSRQEGEPEQVHGNQRIEVSMTLITTGVVGLFFFLTISTMMNIQKPIGDRKPDVIITGHQWWWEIRYPKTDVVTSNEVHLPTKKNLLITFRSADVIHDWWVPDLGRKIDLVPGHPNHLSLRIDKAGTYLGACSEFCGTQHAWMRIRVVAQSQKAFSEWQHQHIKAADQPQSALAQKGAALFHQLTCGNCHRIKGTPAQGTIGPDLTHIASRETLLSGMFSNTKNHLKEWLHNPQKVKKGALMPNFILKDQQVNELAAYLEDLQ